MDSWGHTLTEVKTSGADFFEQSNEVCRPGTASECGPSYGRLGYRWTVYSESRQSCGLECSAQCHTVIVRYLENCGRDLGPAVAGRFGWRRLPVVGWSGRAQCLTVGADRAGEVH